MKHSKFLQSGARLLILAPMLLSSGCVATQDWVQTWVNEQLFPINKRVSETEAGLTKVDGKVTAVDAKVETMAKQISALEGRLNETNAKADRALESLQRLRPERKMVLNFADGAHFATNSAQFSAQAKKDIDSFLSDAKGSADDTGSLVWVVAGHTDSSGSASYNYDLSKRRADSIANYLMEEGKVDPTRVMVVGYGERSPVGDNSTEAGRAKNRRVEILVYKESIAVGTVAAESRGATQAR
ncbi:MAG TPA: OmpA family protein [Terriglobales bacterium]|jgi:outer membrane protein OmpA-like peptidoglycan-associated protein|nr:OmpA family protein [Terriglobales bacterium]